MIVQVTMERSAPKTVTEFRLVRTEHPQLAKVCPVSLIVGTSAASHVLLAFGEDEFRILAGRIESLAAEIAGG